MLNLNFIRNNQPTLIRIFRANKQLSTPSKFSSYIKQDRTRSSQLVFQNEPYYINKRQFHK